MAKIKAKTKRNEKAKPKTSPVEKARDEFRPVKTKIRVIGVGGGGSSIISEIASRVKRATFVAANTDRQALREANRNVIKFQFGESLTHGLGTGMNPELGEMAALNEKEKIRNLVEGQDLCVIVACLGSGTGSGAASTFARIAKSAGALTLGIFTLPFKFEGEKKMEIAQKALEELKPRLHAISIIPNERIFQIIEKETPLRQALSAINTRLAAGLEGLIELIYETGLINIDFADLKTILQGQGRLAYLNCIETQRKEGMVEETIEKLLNSPLYPYGIKGAKSVLYNIAGEKGLSLAEVGQISKTISDLANKDAKIIFGLIQNQKYAGEIKTTLLATGCGTRIFVKDGGKKKSAKKIKTKASVKPVQKTAKKKSEKPVKKTKLVKPEKPAKVSAKKSAKKKSFARKESAPKIKQKRMTFRKPKKTKIKIISEQISEVKEEVPEKKEEVKAEFRIRKNALQIKRESEKIEQEMLEREKIWEIPAFLRRKKAV